MFPVSVWDVVMMGRYGAMNPLRIPRSSDHVAVRDALMRVDLLELADRPLGTLSGGQRKRTFLARAIAQRADVLLLDEPFGALDLQIRESMQDFLLKLWQRTGLTVLLITHDVEEALVLAQRVHVLAPNRNPQEKFAVAL